MIELKMLMDKTFSDPEYARSVANLKRILEKWTLDADFHDAYRRDPDQALAETGLDADPAAVRLLLDADAEKEMKAALKDGSLKQEDLPESYLRYRAFLLEKLKMRETLRGDLCAPDEPRFRAWRERQERRCWLEFGPSARSMVQAPLMFELSEGCSVGCPFCGLASKGLRGIFR